jgi:hypothetical protein
MKIETVITLNKKDIFEAIQDYLARKDVYIDVDEETTTFYNDSSYINDSSEIDVETIIVRNGGR